MSEHYLPWILGFGYAVLVGHVAVKVTMAEVWRSIGIDQDKHPRPSRWQPEAIGLVERALFVTAILVGQAAFIGVWLVLKAVSQWKTWGVGVRTGTRRVSRHEVYSAFVIGSGLSLGYAGAGAYGIILLEDGRCRPAFIIWAVVLAATLAFAFWVRWRGDTDRQTADRDSTGAP